jgi:hypothetical protein
MVRKPVVVATMSFAFACAMSATALAEANADARLRETIQRLDHDLFDSFNKCADATELARHASYFAEDVEFYHDNGGVTWTREAMLANTKQHACGRYTRELVAASFHVSPVKDFGAIATGVHRFCQNGTNECAGEADFVMVWRNTNGKWEVTRTLSFGHRAAAPSASTASTAQASNAAGID